MVLDTVHRTEVIRLVGDRCQYSCIHIITTYLAPQKPVCMESCSGPKYTEHLGYMDPLGFGVPRYIRPLHTLYSIAPEGCQTSKEAPFVAQLAV